MLGFSEEEAQGAFAIRGEREYSASSGPIWVRFEQTSGNSISGNVFAKGCLGSESSLKDCHVRTFSDNPAKIMCIQTLHFISLKIIMKFYISIDFEIRIWC